jgi:DNA-directed RNA polymerase specialized sigma24 family protein
MVNDVASAEVGEALRLFLAERGPALERALVVRFGVDVGHEAAADAVVYCVEHWDKIRGMDNAAGYLFRVGQSAARKHRRWGAPTMICPAPTTVDAPVNVDLQRALMRLQPEQRVALLLTRGFGHSHGEVADLLGCTASNVGNHVTRGLARLKQLMEEQ